jgi:hypothetical protein
MKSREEKEDNIVEEMEKTEIKADGFCFKLHPAEDQVDF